MTAFNNLIEQQEVAVSDCLMLLCGSVCRERESDSTPATLQPGLQSLLQRQGNINVRWWWVCPFILNTKKKKIVRNLSQCFMGQCCPFSSGFLRFDSVSRWVWQTDPQVNKSFNCRHVLLPLFRILLFQIFVNDISRGVQLAGANRLPDPKKKTKQIMIFIF